MWSDNDIDGAFQRLNPPEPEPTPFPLDAWLRLETELDKAVIERAVRRRVWQFFAAEIAVLALAVLGWLLWPASPAAPAEKSGLVAASQAGSANSSAPNASVTKLQQVEQRVAAHQLANVDALPGASSATSAASPISVESSAVAASAVAEPTPPVASEGNSISLPVAVTSSGTKRSHTFSVQPTAENRAHHLSVASNSESKFKARSIWAGSESKAASLVQKAAISRTSRNITAGKSTESMESASNSGATSRHQRAINKTRHIPQSVKETASAREAEALASPKSKAIGPVENETSSGATAAKHLTPPAETAALASRPVAVQPVPELALPSPLATVAVAEEPTKQELPTPARQPRFYIGLVGAPDVTTVKFASIESPLLNVGVTLEYRLTSRLRVSTGLLRAKKQYMARREDYNFGTYAPYITHRYFDDVDGTCTVVDVPLNVRYDFLAQPQYRLFGSAGLSSFFMQREQYSYAYTEYNKPGYWEGELVNQNRHLLSILNLSLGYERSLGTHWSLQAEPYFKLPLAGVGAGKLKLTSAGVFLGIKYGF